MSGTLTAPMLPLCPANGRHSWILSCANYCRSAGKTEQEAIEIIASQLNRAPTPANEIETAVAKAYSTTARPGGARKSSPRSRPPVPLVKLEHDPARLSAVASRITQPRNWRHWLWERSPKRPETQNAYSFLAHLYHPGETVLVFDDMEAWKPTARVRITNPMDCRVPETIRSGGKGAGVWFLSNPVDGQWHQTGERHKDGSPKISCRNHQAVTSWRYAVLESDQTPADQWLAFLVQLPIRIAAIYTSGSRSIHALVRLDAASKKEWDNQVGPLKRPFKVLGADPSALTAVRLTRLPGCRRPEKGGFQRLLYLCPNPPDVRLADMSPLWSRSNALTRWRNLCPRWNNNQEAFL